MSTTTASAESVQQRLRYCFDFCMAEENRRKITSSDSILGPERRRFIVSVQEGIPGGALVRLVPLQLLSGINLKKSTGSQEANRSKSVKSERVKFIGMAIKMSSSDIQQPQQKHSRPQSHQQTRPAPSRSPPTPHCLVQKFSKGDIQCCHCRSLFEPSEPVVYCCLCRVRA